ncbi:MAG: GNAT family N-acetyltransferase [Methanomicrobiaceae archaeon]|nr:GNAT family N-acetyltransferase [Methanomicrobiaceae archaeon]
MAGLRIRRGEIGDANAIAAHNLAMAEETEGKMLDPVTVERGVRAVLEDPSLGFYMVAEEDGRVIGQCMVTPEWSDWRCRHFWWVQSVYVVPDRRRNGVFRRILAAVQEEAALDPDIAGIRLYVDRDNTTAQAAYRALNFTESRYLMFEDGSS